jgi:hypothetical protein
MVFRSRPSDVDQILHVKSSEVDTKNFSSISGWKATELTMSVWPVSSFLYYKYKFQGDETMINLLLTKTSSALAKSLLYILILPSVPAVANRQTLGIESDDIGLQAIEVTGEG